MASGAASRCFDRSSIRHLRTGCATRSSMLTKSTRRRWQRPCRPFAGVRPPRDRAAEDDGDRCVSTLRWPRDLVGSLGEYGELRVFGSLALWRQGPFRASALGQLGSEECRFEAAIDDLPRQNGIRRSVAIQIRVGIQPGFGNRGAPVASVLLGALNDVCDAAVAE